MVLPPIQANQSQRRHSIATGFNLWAWFGTANPPAGRWVNVATSPNKDDLRASQKHFDYVRFWDVVKGDGLPEQPKEQ